MVYWRRQRNENTGVVRKTACIIAGCALGSLAAVVFIVVWFVLI